MTGVLGGAEVYLARLHREFKAQGLEVSSVVPAGTPLHELLISQGAAVMSWPPLVGRLTERRAGNRWISRGSGFLAAPVAKRWLRQLRRRTGCVLHYNSTRALVVGGFPSDALAEMKDVLAPPFMSRAATRLVARQIRTSVSTAVANSQFVANSLLGANVPEHKIATILNGVDLVDIKPISLSERQSIRAHEGWLDDDFVITSVGRLARWKGTHLAAAALTVLVETIPTARLVVVGDAAFDDNKYLKEIHEQIRQDGVESRVQFTGYRHDAHRLMAASDVVLHTSIFPEPLGLTPIESQALGVPVVASAAGGPLETVDHRITGYLFKPGDVSDLCAGVRWAHAANREQVGSAGRDRAEELFDIREKAARYLELYQAL
jgi:glycosyltransferase involved in cell wall biosynthesis